MGHLDELFQRHVKSYGLGGSFNLGAYLKLQTQNAINGPELSKLKTIAEISLEIQTGMLFSFRIWKDLCKGVSWCSLSWRTKYSIWKQGLCKHYGFCLAVCLRPCEEAERCHQVQRSLPEMHWLWSSGACRHEDMVGGWGFWRSGLAIGIWRLDSLFFCNALHCLFKNLRMEEQTCLACLATCLVAHTKEKKQRWYGDGDPQEEETRLRGTFYWSEGWIAWVPYGRLPHFFYEIVHHFFKDVKAGKPGVPYRLVGPMF